jgi:putative FmdB family regulatory protein
MPLYEYTCQKCEHDFEALVRKGESPACPQCESQRLTKRFSVPAAPQSGSSSLPIAGGPSCGSPSCGLGQCGM